MRTKAEIETRFAPSSVLDGASSLFLVGIGGAGMSGLARLFRARGWRVRGSDAVETELTRRLEAEGIAVYVGDGSAHVGSGDVVVLSDAIDLAASPEVARAEGLGRPLLRRSQALGWLLRGYRTIAVTGTHGKTTVTGMIAAALREAGLDPLVVVGAEVPEFGGAVLDGRGEWAVVEACEAYDALRDLEPFWAVLTNLEADHLDFHGDFASLEKSILAFVDRVPPTGGLIYCAEDPGAARVASRTRAPTEGYRRADWDGGPLALPGEHNRLNAAGARLAAVRAGVNPEVARRAIAAFRGAERRLQVVHRRPRAGREDGLVVVDDYAHHPREIAASLTALRERYPGHELVVAFQPHLYSRTRDQLEAFAPALDLADRVVLTDIYPAREDPIPGIGSARILERLGVPADYVPCRHLLARHLARLARSRSVPVVLVLMGAGNIGDVPPALVAELDRPARPRKIAVVAGGDSPEREVSLLSGREVRAALERLGYETQVLDPAELLLGRGRLDILRGPDRPDLAFLCVHGTHAEDGCIQGFFELLGIPYTGSGVLASALAIDKAAAKAVVATHGVRVARGELVTRPDEATLEPPVVVKPNAQGSTIGLSFARERPQLRPALERALAFGSGALVEEWLEGVEISVPVLGDRALPAVEIVPPSGRYDFEAKYTPGATEEICPARIPEAVAREAAEVALVAHRALGCRGATRTDLMVVEGRCVFLEINTLPGMTRTSLLPCSAREAGLSYDELVRWMVEDAAREAAAAP